MISRTFVLIIALFTFSSVNTGFIIKKKKKAKSSKTVKTKKTAPYYNPNYTVVVDKSDYELKVFDAEGWLATYPVVFGKNGLKDKKQEGDQATPEGTFRITWKNPNHKWNKFVLFDYPNAESYKKFYERKASGEISEDAKIGGGVGIHGTWPDSDHVVDNYINWTEGCISMKNDDLDELFDLLPVHTKLVIQR
jgi:murein L,D-transpeptidase YafK